MDNPKEIVGNFVIDENYDNYDSFWDNVWSDRFNDASENTPFRPAVISLCKSWQGVLNTSRMPWMMFHAMKQMYDGFNFGDSDIRKYIPQVGRAIGNKVLGRVPLSPTKSQFVQRAIAEVTSEMVAKIDNNEDYIQAQKPKFDIHKTWHDILHGSSAMQFGVWGGQRICFSALYFAYDAFVGDVVSQFQPDGYEPEIGKLRKELRDVLGDDVDQECFDAEVLLAMLVRHAFAHNGGFMSKKLREREKEFNRGRKEFPFRVDDEGEIHIMPQDVRGCFAVLKNKVEFLLNAAIQKKSE